MVNFTSGDLLIRIKNAAIAGLKELEVSNTKNSSAIVDGLFRLGFIEKPAIKDNKLILRLVFSHKKPVLMNIKLVSKPGLRIYKNVSELKKLRQPETLLISTPRGILSLKEAIKQNVGGEVIAKVL